MSTMTVMYFLDCTYTLKEYVSIDNDKIGKIFELIGILIRIFYRFVITDGYTLNQLIDKIFDKLLTIEIDCHFKSVYEIS